MKYLTRFAFIAAWLFLCAADLQAAETKPHIVLLSGESLYGSATTLPKFAKRLEQQHGYRCTTVVREGEHRFPSLDARLAKQISWSSSHAECSSLPNSLAK